jgi:hypothetical protein
MTRRSDIKNDDGEYMYPDILVDKDCIILDGQCDCPRLEGHSLPECKRYGKNEDDTHTDTGHIPDSRK